MRGRRLDPVPQALRNAIRRKLLGNREFLEKSALALVLPFVAGAVNASGFFIVGVYTSHVTGSVARIGDELAQGHTGPAWQAGLLVAAFLFGAMLSTSLVERARRLERPRYVGALLTESAMLLLVTVLGIAEPRSIPSLNGLTTALLCVAMGIQNALVTKLSGAVVRTTHLTGIITDIGIECVRAWQWFRRAASVDSPWVVLYHLLHPRQVPELRRLRLHVAIASSFLAGALVGPPVYLRTGFASMLLPIVVLLALVLFDSSVGLRSTALPFDKHSSSESTSRLTLEGPP